MKNPGLSKIVLGIVCSLTFLFQTAHAQVQTARYVSMNANTNAYYEYLPQGYSATGTQKYPLILFLHGMGELGAGTTTTLPKVSNNAIPRLIRDGKFPTSFTVNGQTFRFIVISPQFVAWPSSADVNSVLDYVVSHYNVDVSRIYVTGLSMGGGVTWEYAGNQGTDAYAKRVAAIAPICGASYPSIYRANVMAKNNVPVWAFHNEGDPTAPVYYTNDYVSGINSYTPAPNPLAKKTIYPVSGHDAWTAAYNPNNRENGLNVYEWMLQYSRSGSTPPPPANVVPVANAGTDKSITLPTNSVSLSGSGTDSDGSISSYRWSKVSGPADFSFSSTTSAATTVSNLVAGTYTFRLTVTDNAGATDVDDVNVVVNPGTSLPPPPPPPSGSTRAVKVNVFGGSNGSTNAEWNNWNIYSSKTSANLKYSDGTTSSIKAVISAQNAVSDNGSGYTITMAPKEVGRYASYSNVTRTLTLTGLDNTKSYSIELYASRNGISNNTTRFTVSGSSIDVKTDNNLDQKAVFNSLVPVSGQIVVTLSKLNSYNYLNGFILTEVGSGTGGTTNLAPTANAGADKSLTLPSNSTSLTGSGTDADGSIAGYSWSKVSGPSQYSLSSTTVASPTLSNLVEGSYTFRLTVTDNTGATGVDDVNVVVSAAPTTEPPGNTASKFVKVNVFGGANAYSNSEWNNWNTFSSLTMSNLKYSDGTTSSIRAVLSQQNSVSDNGSGYTITMAPKEVGRYASYSTTTRTLTISGLDNSKTYNLELFASRNGVSNNTTRMVTGGRTVDVLTDNNLDTKAAFTSLVPSNGSIVVTISKLNSYNYLNGFILTENGSGTATTSITSSGVTEVTTTSLSVYPNPTDDQFVLQTNTTLTGPMNIQILDTNGMKKMEFNLVKSQTTATQTYLSIGSLAPGNYVVRVQIGNWTDTIIITKI